MEKRIMEEKKKSKREQVVGVEAEMSMNESERFVSCVSSVSVCRLTQGEIENCFIFCLFSTMNY